MTRCVASPNGGGATKLALVRERWHEGDMARRKQTPETSKISRVSTVAYARKQKPDGGGGDGDAPGDEPGDESGDEPKDGAPESAAAAAVRAATGGGGLDDKFDVTDRSQPRLLVTEEKKPAEAKPVRPVVSRATPPVEPAETKPAPAEPAPTSVKPALAEPTPTRARPAPAEPAPTSARPAPAEPAPTSARPAPAEPAPTPARPVRAEPAHTRMDTAAMPVLSPVGRPPEMPPTPAASSRWTDAVENPTNMPGPKEIPAGSPGDPAAAPGIVPRGDSRSLRRRDATTYEFALIYRRETFVITRFGVVGTRGQWRVVEYPTSTAASHSYAKECSRFVSEGFSDYRE
jgi:hypothetical protein